MSFDERDCRNYIAKVRQLRLGVGDVEALRDYFVRMQRQSPNFFYALDIEDEGRLKHVFWADASSRTAYESFGDVITVECMNSVRQQNGEEELYPFIFDYGVLQLSQPLMRGIMDFLECERPTRLSGTLLSYICKTSRHPLIAQSRRCLHKDVSIVLGMLERVEMKVKAPQVMYICPTDAFVVEVHKLVKKIGRHTGITSTVLDPYSQHMQSLNSQLVIGTWNSVHVLVFKGKVQTSNINMVVVDELDYSLAQNTEEDKCQIIKLLGSMKAQILIFYAAFCNSVQQVAPLLLSGAKHNLIFVNPEENDKNRDQKGVFDALFKNDWDVSAPGLARDSEESECLSEFTCRKASRILLTSQCLPRGYDVSTPKVMIFMDIPVTNNGEPDYKTYRYFTSKVGLSGNGMAWTLIQGEEQKALIDRIESRMDLQIRQVEQDRLHEVFQEAVL
ncbi:DEAD-box ATP-dependent RNA helicase 38-like protein [Tanacetum coccineum]